MTIGYISLVALTLVGQLGTFLACGRTIRRFADGMIPYERTLRLWLIFMTTHFALWVLLSTLITL